jgi:alkyldihydroxyacetonephosphate synthase
MRWYGWGEPPEPVHLPDAAEEVLRSELGASAVSTPPVALDEVRLPEGGGLPARTAERLAHAVGAGEVLTDRLALVHHAAGRSYPDLVRLRRGDATGAPDAVVVPGSREEVGEVIAICDAEGVAVVPFGGGTSVVGGVEPLRGRFDSVISLDLRRLDGFAVDRESLLATLGAGLSGPLAERLLNDQGLTLGHFPQSFEHATIGGYVATRSAGQASTGYGRIDELVRGLRMTTPAGELAVAPFPASAAGPSLRELAVGSEGTLGVITEATLAVRPQPEARLYEGWSFRSFEQGAQAFRSMEQAHASPDVARLSDQDETRMALVMSSSGSAAQRAGIAYLRARGHGGGSIAIVGWEGTAAEVRRRRAWTRGFLRRGGGLALGSGPGEAWLRSRYLGPYQRDALLDRGVAVETLETAAVWSRLHGVHRAVREALHEALEGRGTPPIVTCHISHLYPSGASLYFTWLARREEGAELDQWRVAKEAATDAIVANGGTITHHHAVGRDHVRWIRDEVGDTGVAALRALKERLDPNGVMNPGKLLPEA